MMTFFMASADGLKETEYVAEFICQGELWVVNLKMGLYGVSHKETGWGLSGTWEDPETAQEGATERIDANADKLPSLIAMAKEETAKLRVI